METVGTLLVGNGALRPERHARLWLAGPPAWRQAMTPCAGRPALTGALSAAEVIQDPPRGTRRAGVVGQLRR